MREGTWRPNKGHADTGDGGHRADIPSRAPRKAERAAASVLESLQRAYETIHTQASPDYSKFDESIIQTEIRFAVGTGPLQSENPSRKDLMRSRSERAAAWKVIIHSQFGEDVLYEDVGAPPGFREAVDKHTTFVLDHTERIK